MAQPRVTAPIACATGIDPLRDLLPATTLALTRDQLDRLTDAAA